jgi:methionyl-tRNA formyltransferase
MVVAAYGLILPQAVLDLPRLGCLNIHASLLPRWRGAAPIQRAILAGDPETGITIMQMDAGLDTGAMLSKTAVPILETDTAASLHDTLAAAGAAAIVAALANYPALVPQAQDDAQATYAAKLSKEEARLDWRQPADVLARAVRAYNPVPGAWTLLDGAPLKVWSVYVVAGSGAPNAHEKSHESGTVLLAEADRLLVACGSGALTLQEIQPAGGKRMTAAAFLAGRLLPPGTRFGT